MQGHAFRRAQILPLSKIQISGQGTWQGYARLGYDICHILCGVGHSLSRFGLGYQRDLRKLKKELSRCSAKLAVNLIAFPSGGRGTALAVDEVFETNRLLIRQPSAATFSHRRRLFYTQKAKKSPARGGARIYGFLAADFKRSTSASYRESVRKIATSSSVVIQSRKDCE